MNKITRVLLTGVTLVMMVMLVNAFIDGRLKSTTTGYETKVTSTFLANTGKLLMDGINCKVVVTDMTPVKGKVLVEAKIYDYKNKELGSVYSHYNEIIK